MKPTLHLLTIFTCLSAGISGLMPASGDPGQTMDRHAYPFGNAKWIGMPDSLLPFQPDRLTVFRINFRLNLDKDASPSFIYGADDPRLLDRNMNIYNLENTKGSSGIRVEFATDDSLRIYRTGYRQDDSATKPIAIFPIPGLRRDGTPNDIEIRSNLGHSDFFVNGQKAGYFGLNPVGNGGDYLSFPALARFGTEIPDNNNASFSDICIRNFREPGNMLFHTAGPYNRSGLINAGTRSMPELKADFITDTGKKIKKATITVTARGIYDIEINGKRIADDYFNPAYTQYNKTHTYRETDVTDIIKHGKNTIHAFLGEGWWSGPHTFVGENWNFFGDRQSLIANLSIIYDDDSRQEFATSPDSWMARADGPLKAGSFFQGEVFDATPGSGSGRWYPAVEIPLEGTICNSAGSWDNISFIQAGNDRILPIDTLIAIGMTEPRPGVFVYDMGQNFAGIPLLTFSGLKPGTEVSMRYGEVLYPDMPQYAANKGMVMTENLRAAMNHDIYKAAGGTETYSPRFTLHGYRYIELTGLGSPLPLDNVKALPLSSISEIKAGFECSDPLINRLWENIKWSTLSNFISIPTDCAQRNERLGWMGDISVYSPTATKIADLDDLLARYIRTIRDCIHPDGRFPDVAPTGFGFGSLLWGSAGITVPLEHYRQYGKTEIIREHYPAMKRYMEYLLEKTIDPETGIIVQNRAWGDLGDWLSPVYDRDDKSLLWECYLIHTLDIMRQFADILGDSEGSSYYKEIKDRRTEFFNKTYIDYETGKTIFSSFISGKEGNIVDTQASYALPIAFGINRDRKVIENFINTITRKDTADNGTVCPPYSLMTGFIGTAWISKALSEINRTDLAYRLLISKSYPSWLYPVTQGATTIWERLDSYTHDKGFGKNNSMNSFNHYSFGSVADWMLTRSLGIQAAPGLDRNSVTIAPEPDITGHLTYAGGYIDLPAGRVESRWRIDGKRIIYEVTVPEGMNARFRPFKGKWTTLKPGKHTLTGKLIKQP